MPMPVLARQRLIAPVTGQLLSTSLIAFWELEEASGNRADALGVETLTPTNTPGNAGGKVGNAVQLTAASSQHLNKADDAALSCGDFDFTFCCWVYADSFGANRNIATKQNSTTIREWALAYTSGTTNFQFFLYNSSGTAIGTASVVGAPSTATWYFLAGGQDATNDLVWVSQNAGTRVTSATTAGQVVADTAASLRFGSITAAGAQFWDGRIDQAGFWKRLLSDAELSYLYNGGSGRSYAEVAAARL